MLAVSPAAAAVGRRPAGGATPTPTPSATCSPTPTSDTPEPKPPQNPNGTPLPANSNLLYSAHDGSVDQMVVANGAVQSLTRQWGTSSQPQSAGDYIAVAPDGTVYTEYFAAAPVAWSNAGVQLRTLPLQPG